MIRNLATSFIILSFLTNTVAQSQVSFYVSSTGSDESLGTNDTPFLTIARAQQAVQVVSDQKNIVVQTLPEAYYPVAQEQFDIRRVEMRCVASISLERPFSDATMEPFRDYKSCFVRLTDNQGVWGECEFSITGLDLLKHTFVPLLLNKNKFSYETLYQALYCVWR